MNSTAYKLLNETLKMIDGAYAPSTIRAYSKNFERFIECCTQENLSALPSEPSVVARYIQKLSNENLKSASIRLAVASISTIHKLNCFNDPTNHPWVKVELKRMHRKLGRSSKQAYGITQSTLTSMLATLDDSTMGVRNRALLMVAYDSMCRRSELVSLKIENIVIDKLTNQQKIKLQKSKTDQDGNGRWLFLSEQAQKELSRWLSMVNEKNGYIFRAVNRNFIGKSLSAAHINRIYKNIAFEAQLDNEIINKISGHSLRIGATQDLLKNGATLPAILSKGRWSKVDTVMRYLEGTELTTWLEI